MATSPTSGGYTGQQDVADRSGDFNAQSFLVKQALGKVNTSTVVKIVAVTNAGGLSPVGFVDVLPLVNQTDGAGNAVPHDTVHNLPYFRLQGGANAIIIDPQVGDIGIAVFANRDISSVKSGKGQANPGSSRRHDMADGMYLGGILNGVPTQYFRFSATGIEIVSPTHVTISAPNILLNGILSQGTGSLGGGATLQGPVTVVEDLTAANVSVQHHVHGGVQPGSGDTGAPV